MWRSITALVVGFVTIGILAFGTDALVRAAAPGAFDAAGRTNSVPLLLFTLAYVGVYAIAGSYLTARLAPDKPMRHALILGALGLAFNVPASVAVWASAPPWYHLLGLALVMPYAWLGGRLRLAELARRSATMRAA